MPPYHDIAFDEFLAIRICQGQRPQSNYTIPQLILDVIQQCWDADPLKRPEAKELYKLFRDLHYESEGYYGEDATIKKQIKEADDINKKSPSSVEPSSSTGILSYITHSQAIYTSRLLDFKNLPEPKNAEPEYSGN